MNLDVGPLPPYQRQMREFLTERGTDADAQVAMFLLFRTHVDSIAAMESAALRPFGLTHAGFVMLMTLWIMGPQETRQLARVQQVSKPSIVSSVDTLERAGLVRRVKSDLDRRLVTVELTAEGTRMIEQVQPTWHACERQLAGALTPEEQRTLAAMLRKIDAAALGGCAASAPEPLVEAAR